MKTADDDGQVASISVSSGRLEENDDSTKLREPVSNDPVEID